MLIVRCAMLLIYFRCYLRHAVAAERRYAVAPRAAFSMFQTLIIRALCHVYRRAILYSLARTIRRRLCLPPHNTHLF